MVAGESRGHGGNEGYDDQYDAYYSWDDKVPNHKNLNVGDPVAVWDKTQLLGVSVIEEIETWAGWKLQNRCPACMKTRISERTRVLPRWKCAKCKHEFTEPVATVAEVTHYRARYDAAWTSLEGVLDRDELQNAQRNDHDINAMRPLDWVALSRALGAKRAQVAMNPIAARVDLAHMPMGRPGVEIPQGFEVSLVRVRRGQQQFRDHLLAAQGAICAFTGAAPSRALEAGHLYSYAEVGTHYEHGGLMLRRDIHRLFDDGSLAVEPARLRIDVADELSPYPQYARLHGERLQLTLRDEQVGWLAEHWGEHRSRTA